MPTGWWLILGVLLHHQVDAGINPHHCHHLLWGDTEPNCCFWCPAVSKDYNRRHNLYLNVTIHSYKLRDLGSTTVLTLPSWRCDHYKFKGRTWQQYESNSFMKHHNGWCYVCPCPIAGLRISEDPRAGGGGALEAECLMWQLEIVRMSRDTELHNVQPWPVIRASCHSVSLWDCLLLCY